MRDPLLRKPLSLANDRFVRSGIRGLVAASISRKHNEVAGLCRSRDETVEHSTPISWAVNNRGLLVSVRRKRGMMRRRRPRRSASSSARRSAPQAAEQTSATARFLGSKLVRRRRTIGTTSSGKRDGLISTAPIRRPARATTAVSLRRLQSSIFRNLTAYPPL
jgi:hypothetical protein